MPIHTEDQVQRRIQENIKTFSDQFVGNPTLNGNVVKAVFNATYTDTIISHGLGSGAGVSFHQGSSNSPGASVFTSATKSPAPDQTIFLQLTNAAQGTSTTPATLQTPATVTLYFFNAPEGS